MNNLTTKNENFGTDQTFASACLGCGQKLVAQIEQVKNNIVTDFHEAFKSHEQLLNRAVGEAEALAWQTAFPQLVFPTLAMEKIQVVAGWGARQEIIKQRNSAYPMSI
jgi:hypothetical protein